MLGSWWSEEELQSFYRAYRKYGKHWKKVAKRTSRLPDMVKALYEMNKAYLTLSEGKATEGGFIAMMKDRYNRLKGSCGKKAMDQVAKTSHKIEKDGYDKLQLNMQKGSREHNRPHLQTNSAQSRSAHLDSLQLELSRDLFDGSQPRIVRKRTRRTLVPPSLDKNYSSITRNNESTYLPALAVQETSQRGGTPNSSQKIRRTTENISSIPFSSDETRHVESKITDSSLVIKMDQGPVENGQGKTKKRKSEDSKTDLCDTVRETALAAKQGHSVGNSKVEVEKNVKDGKSLGHVQHSHHGTDKFLTEVEESVLNALQDLAASFLHRGIAQLDVKSTDNFVNHRSKTLVGKEREYFSSDQVQVVSEDDTKVEKVFNPRVCTSSETTKNKNIKVLAENFQKASTSSKPCLSEIRKEALVEGGDSSDGNYLAPQHEQGNNIHTPDSSYLNTDLGRAAANSSESTPPAPSASHHNTPPRNRARWKRSLPKKKLQERRSHIPSSYMLRRWCAFEWFYSAIDRPWFAKNKFVEFVNRLQIRGKLTRTEWSIIKSSLGKPFRLSANFLSKERGNLEKYRESLRAHYAELFVGARDSLPKEIAQPLSVNQLVRVRHPRTRELSNGKILYVDREKYKVQFDSPDFEEEFVMDIDCMPINCWENLPEDHRELTTFQNQFCNKLDMDHNAKSCSNKSLDVEDGTSFPENLVSKPNHMSAEADREQNDEHVVGDSENFREQDGEIEMPSQEGSDEVHSPVQNMTMNDLFALNAVSSGSQMSNSSGLTRFDTYDYDGLSYNAAVIVENSILEARAMVGLTITQGTNLQNQPATTDVASSDAEISAYPSELISACVSTLYMIKGLSEERFPPAEVMQILDQALHRLRPLSSNNLSIYSEIENLMGAIKCLMLALLPTNVSL